MVKLVCDQDPFIGRYGTGENTRNDIREKQDNCRVWKLFNYTVKTQIPAIPKGCRKGKRRGRRRLRRETKYLESIVYVSFMRMTIF